MAGAEPQQQAAALGAAESAQPETDSGDGRSAGVAADTCTIAGTAAGAAQRGNRRTRAASGTDTGAAPGGSTPDTTGRVTVAGGRLRRDTFSMRVPDKRGTLLIMALAMAFCASALPAWADEIRLKDGKKLYGESHPPRR